ncbi:galectin-12 isoform X2 [Camelus bactrianus]|uniref:Galectin-12 isoform X2 n=1 Tax=Camelus bactrianus TaxID=9837 RepID=A0AC58R0A0_CAMBA
MIKGSPREGAGETNSWESCPRHLGSWQRKGSQSSGHRVPGIGICNPSWRCPTPTMSPGESLDPLPDTLILQPPVFHPVVPYVTTIFGGLRAGKMVTLQGAVPLGARRFQVDFQCGCSLHPRPDIAIHFNPRFHTTKPHVICNTLHGGQWQAEARWPRLALQRGASFLILFLFGNEEMKVSVNGRHFLHYGYRLPLSRVDTLGIYGDILVTAVGFLNINPFVEGGSEYPVGHPFLLESPRLEVPCSRALPRGLWPGQVIIVRGLVLPEPKDAESGCGCSFKGLKQEQHRALEGTRTQWRAVLDGAEFHAQPAGRGCPCSCDAKGFLRRQNSGLGLALGPEEADLGPLCLLPAAIL